MCKRFRKVQKKHLKERKMDKLKIGVIGTSGRGIMARHWNEEGARSVISAGMDTSDTALESFKETAPDARTSKDIDDFLSKDDFDAVAIMSPDFTHEEYAIKAFQAGKHVFCEKPMAIRTDGCDGMLKAWKESGKKFMIGFNMRYMNIFRVMKDIVDSGDIGEIKTVWVRHFVGMGGDWYYHDWHANREKSTGLLLQKASHDIDMIHWISGKYTKKVTGMGNLSYYGGDKPNDLKCPDCDEKDSCIEYHNTERKGGSNYMNQCVFRREVDVEDTSIINMELEDNIMATYMQCHFSPVYFRNYVFTGTEGSVENLDDNSKVEVKFRKRSKRWKNLASSHQIDVRPADGGHGGADPRVCKDFIEMVLDGKTPIATPLAGRMSVATACAGTESIRNNSKLIEIKPVPAELADFVF